MINAFGTKLSSLRKELGYSQKSFSDYLGIPQPSLSAYENGKNSPTIEVLINIAQKCNVSIDWLCGITSTQININSVGQLADYSDTLMEFREMKPQIQQLERIAQALNYNLEKLCEYKKVTVESTFEPTQFEDYGKGLTVGDKIKIYREKKGLTQLEVANLLNLKAGYVRMSQYESHKRGRTPKKEMLEKLASIFEVEVEYLKERNIEGKKDVIAILEEIKLCFGIEIIKDFISDYES